MFARVVFQSPLPALDREFEYSVPSDLAESIVVGQRVRVSFAGQIKEGFVVKLTDSKEFSGKVAEIGELVSRIPVLTSSSYSLAKAIAERQCCAIGEILSNMVPKRSVRVENAFSYLPRRTPNLGPGKRWAELVHPVADSATGIPLFIQRITEITSRYLEEGRSVIVVVPDFRDLARLKAMFFGAIDPSIIHIVDSSEVASEKYLSFLNQLTSAVGVVLGTRNAIYSPMPDSAALVIWDDGDQSHQDQQAPYLTTREIALLRQSLFGSPIHFLSHSRSTEVQRLINIGYLEEQPHDNWRPRVSLTEGKGLDSRSFQVIKRGLTTGPVLVQVATPGVARSLFCDSCGVRSMCSNCNGPLWLNSLGQISCRWCGQLNLNFRCSKCSQTKLKQGAAGATRWAEQLGKSFPGIAIREISAEQVDHQIPSKPAIIICTPGIEPIAIGGYSAVVLLDCSSQLNQDSLRAPEDGLRSWLNALAFMNKTGEAIAVGVSDEVSAALSLGEISKTVNAMLAEREQLGFPPAKRFVSATGSRAVIESLEEKLKACKEVNILGVSQSQGKTGASEFRLVASFSYASGMTVANLIREFVSGLGAKMIRTNSRSGRNVRPLSVKFDDPRVI